MPLWGVAKESIKIYLKKTTLYISWERIKPDLKETLKPKILECFWWKFTKEIPLPTNIYFDKVHSHLTENNVLIITVPKIIIPDHLEIKLN